MTQYESEDVMKLTNADTEYVAQLANLDFTEQEKKQITKDLSAILDYVEMLGEVDTTGVEPLTHVTEEVNVTRKDEVGQTLDIQQVLANAPQKEGRTFKMPKML